MGDFTSSSFATYKNHFLIVKIPLKIGQVISIYWIFSGSFLDNLEFFFFFSNIMATEKNNYSSNA